MLSCLGIERGQVFVTPIINTATIPVAQQVFVEPLSVDDWEMIELNAGQLEAQLVNQVAVVKKDLVIPVWAYSSKINLRIRTCL